MISAGPEDASVTRQEKLKLGDEHPHLGQHKTSSGIHTPDCMIVAYGIVQFYLHKSTVTKIVSNVPMRQQRDARAVDASVMKRVGAARGKARVDGNLPLAAADTKRPAVRAG